MVMYSLPMRLCHYQLRFNSKASRRVVGEKCEVSFSFHIQFFLVTNSTYTVFYSSVINGAGYDVPVGGCHYKVKFGWLTLLL